MTILYGIPNCDTVRKARAWLEAHGVGYTFHDYKKAGIDEATLRKWSTDLGWHKLLNRAGTTFRKLPDADRAELTEDKAIALMLAQPSMIRRPVIEHVAADGSAALLTGFDPDAYLARIAAVAWTVAMGRRRRVAFWPDKMHPPRRNDGEDGMAVSRNEPPVWFWIAAALIVLWGLMGVAAFYLDVAATPDQVARMSAYDQKLLASRPAWFLWLYGAATCSGLLGGVLLLLRSSRAHVVFVISLLLVVAMFGYVFAVTDLIAVKGFVTAAGFPILVAVTGAFEVWFAVFARRRAWLA